MTNDWGYSHMFDFEKRFRLRRNNKIVGYMREGNGKTHFYSRDGFWWSGKPIYYEQLDEWTGWLDKNRKHIFEWDIVKCKLDPDGPYEEAAVLWQKNAKRFTLAFLNDSQLHIPLQMNGLQMFSPNQIEIISYLFINPDIMEQLGVKDE